MLQKEYHNKVTIYCSLLRSFGCAVEFKTKKEPIGHRAFVKVLYNNKLYHFSDPDWKVVIGQLDKLVDKIFIPEVK